MDVTFFFSVPGHPIALHISYGYVVPRATYHHASRPLPCVCATPLGAVAAAASCSMAVGPAAIAAGQRASPRLAWPRAAVGRLAEPGRSPCSSSLRDVQQ
jgi:hypothetical protein